MKKFIVLLGLFWALPAWATNVTQLSAGGALTNTFFYGAQVGSVPVDRNFKLDPNFFAAPSGTITLVTNAIITPFLPWPVSQGGTGVATASGTALDNITGFTSIGLLNRTGAGAYSFKTVPTGAVVGDTDTQTLTHKSFDCNLNTCSNFPGGGAAVTQVNTGTGLTGGPITGTGTIAIVGNGVTNALMAQMNSNTIKGNNAGGLANPADLSTAQVAAILPAFTGDSGAGGVQGLVPAPPAGSAAANKVLGAGGTWVANGSAVTSVATGQGLTGGPITTTGTISVPNNGITNALIAQMPPNTIKGNNTGVTGTPADLTATQVSTLLPLFTGDSGAGGVKGLVPPPAAGDAAANKVLGAGGGWVAQAGGGGSPLTVTDGTHSVTSTTSISAGNGFVVGGSAGAATLNFTVTDPACKTANYTVAATDMGNALNLCATSGTPTLSLPAASATIFAPGMTLSIVNTGTITWTMTNSSGLTLATSASLATLPPGVTGTFVANADGTHLDFFGYGFSTTTFAAVIGKVTQQSGTTYTFAASDCGTVVEFTSGSAVTLTMPATLAIGCHIGTLQAGAGQLTFAPGAGASGPNNPHSYTKSFGQGAGVSISVIENAGGSAAKWYLFGDGA